MGPDDTIHIVPLPSIDKTIPPRIQSSDLFALDEVEGVDGGGAVTMGAHRVDITQEGSIERAVLQLGGRVCRYVNNLQGNEWDKSRTVWKDVFAAFAEAKRLVVVGTGSEGARDETNAEGREQSHWGERLGPWPWSCCGPAHSRHHAIPILNSDSTKTLFISYYSYYLAIRICATRSAVQE